MSDPVARLGAYDRLRGGAGRLLARLPDRVQLLLSGRPRRVVDGQSLDPALQLLTAFAGWKDKAATIAERPIAFRERLRREILAVRGPQTPVGAVRDLRVDGAAGHLPARLYLPDGGAPESLLVFFHGGGFVAGDLDTHDEACRLLCRGARQAVLSVAYRLAPESRFPAAVDDAVAAFRWARRNTARLGVSTQRVSVGGDSAGANLAAVVSQLEAGTGAGPCGQLLIYPPTDQPTPRRSHELFDDGVLLRMADRNAFYRQYTGGSAVDPTDPRLSPRYAASLAGLPRALVVIAGFDVLRDEGEAYARALTDAGVTCEVQREPSLGHGFVNLTGVSRASHRAVVEMARRWRALLDAA